MQSRPSGVKTMRSALSAPCAAAEPDECSAASAGVTSRMIQVTIAGCSPLRSLPVESSVSRCPDKCPETSVRSCSSR